MTVEQSYTRFVHGLGDLLILLHLSAYKFRNFTSVVILHSRYDDSFGTYCIFSYIHNLCILRRGIQVVRPPHFCKEKLQNAGNSNTSSNNLNNTLRNTLSMEIDGSKDASNCSEVKCCCGKHCNGLRGLKMH